MQNYQKEELRKRRPLNFIAILITIIIIYLAIWLISE